jgi:hypothetical protein
MSDEVSGLSLFTARSPDSRLSGLRSSGSLALLALWISWLSGTPSSLASGALALWLLLRFGPLCPVLGFCAYACENLVTNFTSSISGLFLYNRVSWSVTLAFAFWMVFLAFLCSFVSLGLCSLSASYCVPLIVCQSDLKLGDDHAVCS